MSRFIKSQNIYGAPLAVKIIRTLSAKYPNGIPYEKAETYLENTNGILSYGRSVANMIQKLKNYGLIKIVDDNIFLNNLNNIKEKRAL